MSAVEISYKGSQIASMDATGVKTLLTGDTFCEDDIVIQYTAPSAPTPTGTKQITISGAGTVTEDVTNYANAAITTPTGTAGTPTATKGAVSGHAVSVTPSVTNSAGWVSSETKNGTPVSVSAAELVSGTLGITQNGTGIDVTNYAAVDVSVSGGGGEVMILYTNSNYSNVYVDANLTTTLVDSYDYDYDAIYADIISASAVKVIKNTSGGGDVVNVVSIRYDKIDETFYLFVLLPSVNWGTNNWKSISIY